MPDVDSDDGEHHEFGEARTVEAGRGVARRNVRNAEILPREGGDSKPDAAVPETGATLIASRQKETAQARRWPRPSTS